MDYHPTPKELEGLVLGGLSAGHARAVIAHLLRGCARCTARLAPHLHGLFGLGNDSAAPPPPEDLYDVALDRAFAAVQHSGLVLPPVKTLEEKKQEVLDLLSAEGLDGLRKAPRHLQGPATCKALLERSWALRHQDPDQMVLLAQYATLLADRLSEGELSAKEITDLRCRAWVELGNAYRVADELDPADEALGRATVLFLLGTGDDLLGARLFDALASQFAARRSFDMARTALDVVAEVYRRNGDEHLAGRALISKGIYTGYQGDAEEAVCLIRRGLSAVDERRDPGLVSSSVQTLAWFLVDCGEFREARRALWNLRRRGLEVDGRVNELKLRWLEGHIYVGLGQLDWAEQALAQVKQGFDEAGLKYKAALAGLELGVVWLRQGRADKVTAVVLESADVFLSLRIEREVFASVQLLRKAGEMRRLTVSILTHVIEFLRRAEQDPSARFLPPSAEP